MWICNFQNLPESEGSCSTVCHYPLLHFCLTVYSSFDLYFPNSAESALSLPTAQIHTPPPSVGSGNNPSGRSRSRSTQSVQSQDMSRSNHSTNSAMDATRCRQIDSANFPMLPLPVLPDHSDNTQ